MVEGALGTHLLHRTMMGCTYCCQASFAGTAVDGRVPCPPFMADTGFN